MSVIIIIVEDNDSKEDEKSPAPDYNNHDPAEIYFYK